MYGTLISSVTVGSGGAASIEFTSIPQTYTDLIVVVSGRAVTNLSLYLKFNAITTGYTGKQIYANGANAYSYNDATYPNIGNVSGPSDTANTFGNGILYIPNYSGSTNKSYSADFVSENNATTAYQMLYAGVVSNTAAITSITFTLGSGNFAQYSTAYLYGLLKGSGGATAS